MFMTFWPTLPSAATVAVAIRKTISEYSIAVAARMSDLRRRMSDSISRLRENPVQSSACAGADNVRLVTLVKFVAARWFEQKWAAVAGRPSFRSLSWPQRLVHRVGDVAEHVGDLAADGGHGGDGGDGDQRGDERVLDGRGALLVLHKTTENGQHVYLQKKSLLDLRFRLTLSEFWGSGRTDTNAGA